MKTKRTRSSFRSMNSERKLESIFLFVTGKCNAKCAMCFYANDMAKKEKDLTFEEIRKISETAGEINKLWGIWRRADAPEDLPEILEMFYRNNQIKGMKPPPYIELMPNEW